MDRSTLAARIDHTVLGPTTTVSAVRETLDEALSYGMNACVPPCYTTEASTYAPSVDLVTVIGFPHGQHSTAVKRDEAVQAWEDGADELDMVINIGRLKADDREAVREDMEEVVAAVPIPVKAIIEAPLLTAAEKRAAAEAAVDADIDYLKTATGFADGGATVEDVSLLAEYLPVKASGGIGTWADAKAMLDAGAERIGASAGVAIMRDFEGKQTSD